jgi:hypothetical protein
VIGHQLLAAGFAACGRISSLQLLPLLSSIRPFLQILL